MSTSNTPATAQKRQPIPFGKYLLLDRVNIGGMAEVWRAKSFGADGFEQIVAIKRILPNIAEDEEFITMFVDEAKITVQLKNANIAQILDLGKLVGNYYIAMEYVSGKDMRAVFDRCRKRGEPAPIPLICYAIAECCKGLDYAHHAKDKQGRDMGVVHRDVSPQNALISYDGEVKVIDFGIAKAAGKATKTQAGILKGKFGYMSPEQIRGLPLDGRSDLFAMGVCLYEMLTGERLFVGDSDFSVLEKVRKVEVLPPSHFNRKIPPELEQIVMKALAKDVDDRYQRCSDLGEALIAFMYATGNTFARKDLAAFMKATFAEDYEKEKLRLQDYTEVKAPEGMLAAIEMGFGVGPVPQTNQAPAGASSVTNVPTSVPINVAPGQGQPPAVRPSVPPTLGAVPTSSPSRPPSLTSIPRLTAVAPMLTNGKEEHDSTVLADAAGPQFDDSGTSPGADSNEATRAFNIRTRVPEESTTDPERPAVRSPTPMTTVPERKMTRNVPMPVPLAVAPTGQNLPPVAAPNNNGLIIALAAVVAALIIGVVAVFVLKPAATGLVMVSVPDGAEKTAKLSINGESVPVGEWPAISKVPVGKATVKVSAEGYETLVEVVDVKEGNEATELAKKLKKRP